MELYLYLDKNTYMHRLDPRSKLLVLLTSFAFALILDSIPGLVLLLLLVLAYGASGRILSNLNQIKFILFMIAVFSVVIWSLTGPGSTRILGVVTLEGFLYGVITGLKINIMTIAGMIFLGSTKIEEISLALQKLKVPYRVAFAISTALRLVPLIVATGYTIIQAQKSRGLDLDSGGVITRIKKYPHLLVPAFVSVIRSTNVFAMALESKGFGYSNRRSSYLQISFKTTDYIVIGTVLLLLSGAIYLKLTTNMV